MPDEKCIFKKECSKYQEIIFLSHLMIKCPDTLYHSFKYIKDINSLKVCLVKIHLQY